MTRLRFYLCAVLAALCIAASSLWFRSLLASLPPYDRLEEYTPSLTSRVFDAQGDLVAELSIEKRALLTLAEIPVDLQNAVLATEDSRFFQHCGISPRSMLRAAVRNFLARRVVEGGSTLTQQLTKLIFLTPEKKIIRKIKEMVLALQMERNLSKDEIFQLYLNQIYFGHRAYGVQAAAHIYFAKDVKDLTLAECALLGGLVKYPGGYSPFRHPEAAEARRKLVLGRMLDEGFIRSAEMEAALKEPMPVERPGMTGVQAPYFVEYIRRRLEPKYGYDTFWRGGLNIHTTLDLRMQKVAETELEKAAAEFDKEALAEWEKQLKEDIEAGIEPPSVSTTPPSNVQAVFLILDVRSGAVRAMVGGRGDQFNRAVQAQRQPGSTFKPFVWAAALGSGMTGMTLVEDAPLAYYYDGRDWRLLEGATDQYAIMLATAPFAGSDEFKVWVPTNFDDKFMGVITLRKALALSRNMVSVRLTEHVGPPRVVELAHKAGVRSRLAPVLSLGLGTSVVSPLEMANAFETFANGGIHVQPYTVERVEDANGRVLQQHLPKEEEAVSTETSYLVTHLMKVAVESGTGRRAAALKRPLAGKTGTSNDNRDMWFVGYTPDLVAVAWMGYDDFSPIAKRHQASSSIVPWWTTIMGQILKDYPPRDFPKPEGITFHQVDVETGMLALPTCPKRALQAFLKGTEPQEYCNHDHAQPLRLQAAFGATRDMGSTFFEAESGEASTSAAGGDGLPALPSDDELDSLLQPGEE
jgi:penicillin-binding protein 1A